MNTNLDYLHKVVMEKPQGRQTGKTFVRCHQLAGAVGLGDAKIVCEISFYRDIDYLRYMIQLVFDDHGLDITWIRPYVAQAGKSRIWFFLSNRCEDRTRGMGSYTYVPMRHQD